ncbi:hypothetical protein FK220_007995 [Flavobacteriaceae bacterium TP-CH-4]|uniref:Uncharacterized protein n=1 Tax=Pelagihabitans pacificus TaxID=2696054 RepID=A0A967AX90_9FLAO|nr:hypothetical protein [Pelagihabitans pacificus]NHF59277.1 hypothetical protein [Pelagihabitans pacificus]
MSLHLDNFKNQPPISVIEDNDIAGLFMFKKSLEKLFFSEVVIRNSATEGQTVKLIIEVSCNFNLIEGMTNLEQNIWAQCFNVEGSFENSRFYNLVRQLQLLNNFEIDVEEFSIIFNDCNLIINKIYEGSIPEQLGSILTKVSQHYVNLTKNYLEVPFEIFIPIFEEINKTNEADSPPFKSVELEKQRKKAYFNYWGLYFYSEDDGLVYTLQEASIISGELNMLTE